MFRKWSIRVSIVFLVLVLGLSTYLYINSDSLKDKAIKGLNAVLDAKVNVGGTIDLTFLSTFPKVTIEFQEVFIEDRIVVGDTLAQITKVNFSINPLSLFQDTIAINSVKLSDGMVKLKKYKDGNSNFEIIKTNEQSDTSSSVSLQLEKVEISKLQLIYSDDQISSYFTTFIDQASVSGQFYNKDFTLDIDLIGENANFQFSKTQFLNQNLLNAKISLDYNSSGVCFTFKENEILIDHNSFSVDGNICNLDKTINLNAISEGNNIADALKLVPKDILDLKDVKGNGKYFIELQLSEKLDKPKISINFSLENAKLSISQFPLKLTEVYTTGSFSNRPKNNLKIKDFDFKINDSHLSGNVFFPNLSHKKIQIKAHGEVNSEELQALNIDHISFEEKGSISFDDLHIDLNHRTRDSNWIASKFSGKIKVNQLKGKFTAINQDFSCHAQFNAGAKKIDILKSQFKIGNNDLEIKGSLHNALNYFQGNIFDSNEPLIVKANVFSESFDINSFLRNKNKQDQSEISDLLKWLNIKMDVSLAINKLSYKKLIITDLNAKLLSSKAGVFNINQLSAQGLEGNAKGNVELRFFKDRTLEVSLNSSMKRLNIRNLFKSFENFDQNTIRSENLKGFLTADLILSMSFKNFVDFEPKKLLVQTDFEIQEGEFINLVALHSMSKYLSLEQLNQIYFADYKSELKIIDEVIYLQNNRIKSNVLSLEIGGSHSFNEQIDYLVKLNLSNLLAAKFKKNKTLQQDYINDSAGGIHIFLSLKGDVNNPEIKIVKRKAFKENKKEKKPLIEKQDIKKLFKKENLGKPEQREFYFEGEEEEFIEFE